MVYSKVPEGPLKGAARWKTGEKGSVKGVFDDKGNLVDGEFKVFDENYIDIKMKGVLNGKKVKVVFKKNRGRICLYKESF